MRRLDIDPTRVEMGWIMDFCAQSLRNIIIGIGSSLRLFTGGSCGSLDHRLRIGLQGEDGTQLHIAINHDDRFGVL